MKFSIRSKFTLGMIFLFLIILILSVFSGYYLNNLAKKTGAILKENYLSVVYAREMSDGLTNINLEIVNCFLLHKTPDSIFINRELSIVHKSLESEKKNITEPGEEKLVSEIESGMKAYCDSVTGLIKTSLKVNMILYLQNKSGTLYKQLMLLSQINGKAIEVKTDDAKVSSKKALAQMTILGTFCFLIAFSFTFSFASYFSQRFFQLYNGIKEIVSSNYGQRLYFDGKDEFNEISLVFNEMAEKLNLIQEKMSLTLQEESRKAIILNDIKELKNALSRIKSIEEQTSELISRLEKKK